MVLPFTKPAQTVDVLLSLVQIEVNKLSKESADLEKSVEFLYEQRSMVFSFFKKDGRDSILKFVEFCFKKYDAKTAIAMTEYFHDDFIDLSILDCCKAHFTPWA